MTLYEPDREKRARALFERENTSPNLVWEIEFEEQSIEDRARGVLSDDQKEAFRRRVDEGEG